jgi:hypothetical protein
MVGIVLVVNVLKLQLIRVLMQAEILVGQLMAGVILAITMKHVAMMAATVVLLLA